jgi:hypothetical protein
VTHRAQLVVLAVLLLLLALAVVAPPTRSETPVMATAVPQSEFSPLSVVLPSSVGSATVAKRRAGPDAPGYNPALPSPDAKAVSDRVLARANETPNPSSKRRVALPPATAKPSPASIVLAARSGTRVAGTASWWASFGPGIYAALPGYVAGTHVTIRVCAGDRCVDAPVITSCQCFVGTPRERIVDVSPGILRALGLDPGSGLFPVTIERLP